MRMKKIMILAAVAAIAATACTKTFEAKPTAETPIGFGSWANTLTKARTPGSSTFAAGDEFEVYGYKTRPDDVFNIFDGDVVSTTDGTTWTYESLRFWDPRATSYTFFAVSPAGKVASTVNGDHWVAGGFNSVSITFAGNDNDFYNPVEMQFNHIASLVDFKVKKHADLAQATVEITDFSISNIDNVGTFAVTTAYSVDNHPDYSWTATAHAGSYDNTSGAISVATLPTDIGTTGEFVLNNLVAMPQTFRTDLGDNPQTVDIEYLITDRSGNRTAYQASFNLKMFDNVDDTDNEDTLIGGWEGGKHYTFYITINANAIVFTASINDWVTTGTTGYNYLLK